MLSDDTILYSLGTCVAVVEGLGRCWPVSESAAWQGYYDHVTNLDDNTKQTLHQAKTNVEEDSVARYVCIFI